MNTFFKHSFFNNKKYIITIWFVITIISVVKQFLIGNYNNYKIFKGVYFHTINKLPLYEEYPLEYFDHNHYGPVFSLIIAPFAILPDYIGMVLWGIFNAAILVWAITQLPLKQIQITAIYGFVFMNF